MGQSNNHPNTSGDERLATLQKNGQFLEYGPYQTLTAGTQYAIDTAFDKYMLTPPAAEPPRAENTVTTTTDQKCVRCGTEDEKAFESPSDDRCVSCEEIDKDLDDEHAREEEPTEDESPADDEDLEDEVESSDE